MAIPKNPVARSRPDIAASLTEFDLEANNNKMIATKLLPVFEANQQGGNFGRIKAKQLLQSAGDIERASGAGYKRRKWEFEDHLWFTREYGVEEKIDERDSNRYADYFDHELIATSRSRSATLIRQEVQTRDMIFGVPAAQHSAAGTPWTNWTGSDPITIVENAIQKFWKRTGIWPNALGMSYLTFRNLRQNQIVLDRVAANGAGDRIRATDITTQQIAEVFDLQHICVGGAAQDGAGNGLALDVQMIWGTENAFLIKIPDTNDLEEPAFGRTFHWSEDGSRVGGLVESYWEESCRSWVYRLRHEIDPNRIYTELVELITGVGAP